jgi:uncharacterized protein (DUF433 family)
MKVERALGNHLESRRDTHRTRGFAHSLPDSWIEARERVNALPCDDSQTIGDAFNQAISKLSREIWRDKQILRGVPCLRDTRIPVYQVCGMMAEGYSIKRIAKFLYISEKRVRIALKFASIVLEQ